MKIAIVTGASSGLGRAFARRIDRMGLDEIWLIARREERLRDLAGELCTAARVFPLDLTRVESIGTVKEALEACREADVRVLVNAAGFGKLATWRDLTLQETNDMIALNCRAAVDMSVAVLPHMGPGSRLFEICSSSAFQPLPGLNVYASTKAFLLHFTRALRWEAAGKGVRITAVCPGWIKTEFMDVARDTKNGHTVRHFPLAIRPETAVNWAMLENSLGFAVATCGPHTLVQRIAAKFLPNCVLMACWEGLRRI